jgi:hypothetical protein
MDGHDVNNLESAFTTKCTLTPSKSALAKKRGRAG